MTVRLYNTATRSIEEFTPPPPHEVTMYTCGPTVYNYAHIGNLRAYVFADVLRRTLEMNGYTVKHVTNITDVGHLVSDGDEGEDKMVVGAAREGKSVEEIITMYSDAFHKDLRALNIKEASYPRATDFIPDQKKLIETLAAKGFTYTTSDGIYFDTSKFPRYADFAHLDISGLREGARVEANDEKRNPTDFAVWKFSPQDGVKREQEWDSPLGISKKGFPGWHIECSAIAMKELGETIDIHTGGIDHIPVHHTNEIAQSESATGKQFARFWMHSAHMMVDGQKMSKSLGNTYRLSDLAEKGISPLGFRYWLLTANYRTQVNFTWDAVMGAQRAYDRLREKIYEFKNSPDLGNQIPLQVTPDFHFSFDFDLNTSATIPGIETTLTWNTLGGVKKSDCLKSLNDMDQVLGLKLLEYEPEKIEITPELKVLLEVRQSARDTKNYAESDRFRDEIKKLGYEVKDTPDGQILSPL